MFFRPFARMRTLFKNSSAMLELNYQPRQQGLSSQVEANSVGDTQGYFHIERTRQAKLSRG